jgi:hypothetical protein
MSRTESDVQSDIKDLTSPIIMSSPSSSQAQPMQSPGGQEPGPGPGRGGPAQVTLLSEQDSEAHNNCQLLCHEPESGSDCQNAPQAKGRTKGGVHARRQRGKIAAAACEPCRKSKVRCLGGIPCKRCKRRCTQSSCVLHERKRGYRHKRRRRTLTLEPAPVPTTGPSGGPARRGLSGLGDTSGLTTCTADAAAHDIAFQNHGYQTIGAQAVQAVAIAVPVGSQHAHLVHSHPYSQVSTLLSPFRRQQSQQPPPSYSDHRRYQKQQQQQQQQQQMNSVMWPPSPLQLVSSHGPVTWHYQQHDIGQYQYAASTLTQNLTQMNNYSLPAPMQTHRYATGPTPRQSLPHIAVAAAATLVRAPMSTNYQREVPTSMAYPMNNRDRDTLDRQVLNFVSDTQATTKSESDDTIESHALIIAPQQNNHRSRHPHTFMVYQTPTIRQRISHLEAAAQLLYNNCRSPSWVMTERQSADIFRRFTDGMRAVFNELHAPASMEPDEPRRQRRQNMTVLTELERQRADFERFMLGVICMAMQDSQHEAALARAAHDTMMRRAQAATGVLELRKGTLDMLPMCVCAKALYPDWTKGCIWINKRAMEVMGVDPSECPDQMIPMATFIDTLSHPVNRGLSSSHVAFSIANNRSDACHYRVWKHRDGTYVAGMHSNRYLLGPAPMHRLYFIYIFFQPLPVQPVDIDAWSRRVMIASPSARRHSTHHSDGIGWTAAGTSAKYPGIMHQLIQDHIRLHPEDAEKLPPNPRAGIDLY